MSFLEKKDLTRNNGSPTKTLIATTKGDNIFNECLRTKKHCNPKLDDHLKYPIVVKDPIYRLYVKTISYAELKKLKTWLFHFT